MCYNNIKIFAFVQGETTMEKIMLILTIIGTAATVISTVLAIRAKNEAQSILKEVTNMRNRNVTNSGKIEVNNAGVNSGIISGVNTGEVNSSAK